MENIKYSKMIQKYLETKREYPDCILFYRLGDFYEMFFEDAEHVSSLLGLTLTARDCGSGQKAPMCGVPYHAAHTYVSRLTKLNHKVAICEQLGEASSPNAPMERGVVRIITPGTIMDETALEQNKNNFIVSVSAQREGVVGLAWMDITTGEFNVQQFTGDDAFTHLSDTLAGIGPSEIIADELSFLASEKLACVRMGVVPTFYRFKEEAFLYDNARNLVLQQLNAKTLSDLHCENYGQAICASGALLSYLQETQMRALNHINKINVISDQYYMNLDINTRLNLEICETMYDRKKKGSLLWVIDKTQTTMGARLLRNWLEQPLQNLEMINSRLDAVEELFRDMTLRSELREILRNFQDIERLCGRVSFGNLNPKTVRL